MTPNLTRDQVSLTPSTGTSRDKRRRAPRHAALLTVLALGALGACGEPPATDEIETTSALYSGVGNCPTFSDNDACLCEDPNLTGYCQIFTLATGIFPNPDAFSPFHNDRLSSLVVGANVAVRGYEDAQFGYVDVCTSFCSFKLIRHFVGSGTPNVPTTFNSVGNFDNKMSSVRVLARVDEDCSRPVRAGTVVLYTNGPGNVGDCVVLGRGTYAHPDWPVGKFGTKGSFGMHNDWMSAVSIPTFMSVRLWKDVASVTPNGHIFFTEPHIDLTTAGTTNLSAVDFDNRVSAVEVF